MIASASAGVMFGMAVSCSLVAAFGSSSAPAAGDVAGVVADTGRVVSTAAAFGALSLTAPPAESRAASRGGFEHAAMKTIVAAMSIRFMLPPEAGIQGPAARNVPGGTGRTGEQEDGNHQQRLQLPSSRHPVLPSSRPPALLRRHRRLGLQLGRPQ